MLQTKPTMTQTSTVSSGRKEVETISIQTQTRLGRYFIVFGQVAKRSVFPMLIFPHHTMPW